jgi:hypothetical protein
MNLVNNKPDERVISDILKRIEQIITDTGYGRIFICIQNNEVKTIEHTVTKVFKSVSK